MDGSSALATVGQGENATENMEAALKEMPRNMLVFSITMRSLYVEKGVGTYESAARKFRELRDDTRNDAMVYLKVILPMSQKLVNSIQELFEYYQYLSYKDWIAFLPDILEDVHGHRQICEAVVKMHESIMVPLKKREDQAKLVMAEMNDLQQQFEERKKELGDKADVKKTWLWITSFIPVVNIVASPLLKASMEKDLTNAIAHGAQAESQEAAALAVTEGLMPALKAFIKGLQKAAGFFQVMENELGMFAGSVQKAKSKPAKLHYIMMKKKSKAIKSSCQMFVFALPQVRTDFAAIPDEGTDKNYVERWLAKQLEIIKKTCTKEIVDGITSGISALVPVFSRP